MATDHTSRRRFLRFLLTSPLLAELGGVLEALGDDPDEIITAPNQALDVLDVEPAALVAHWRTENALLLAGGYAVLTLAYLLKFVSPMLI